MARKLRVQYPGAIYHVMNRGDHCETVFRDGGDPKHWGQVLSFGQIGVDEAALRCLNGPMARPLRIERPGGRSHVVARGNERKAIFRDATDRFHFLELLSQIGRAVWGEGSRLCADGQSLPPVFRWSSYPGYVGYTRPWSWVWREPLARLCGGNSPEEQCAALRAYTEGAVVQGGVEPPWGRVVDGIALGSQAFAQELRREARGNGREQKSLRGVPATATWPQVVCALEQAKGESWSRFANRHGDWGRDAALWLGRRVGRLPLFELGKLAGGLDYAVVRKPSRVLVCGLLPMLLCGSN
jgi:hypothetical protein